ncbi:lysylphosphatidylglycerol synthase transmembrane domain-containing protein [Baekduia soli]|uniref:lysylphosphatidylglycerol synthase transmembrane domain-containing protein n=1 Tax=Baekduia soli TaxID=496014 RepID=UPI0016528DCB|nr:lysylphosphatidylglycerol synthase transmembrane domain-containing protein [Baekduia soli]
MIDRLEDLVGGVWSHFDHVDGRLLLVALVFHVANHVLRSVAWRNVLAGAHPGRRVPLLGVASAYAIGVALNAVVPGRGGDAAKLAIVRSRIEGSRAATIASTMAVIMLFDLVAATLLVLVVGLTGSVPFVPHVPLAGAPGWMAAHVPIAVAGVLALTALVALAVRVLRGRVRGLLAQARQGGAILRSPARYVTQVALVQAGAWTCRIAVVFLLLRAFGLHATVPTAALVMVLCGASTLIPLTPGGAGTQQVMLAYALGQAAGAAVVLSFSVGMQAGITLINAALGLAAAMVAFRTLRPVTAVRAGLGLARARA